MAKKTVRILRTLPLDGRLYRANNLVSFDTDTLKTLPGAAIDATKAAVDYCKSIGVDVIDHGAPVEGPADDNVEGGTGEDEGGSKDEGELTE